MTPAARSCPASACRRWPAAVERCAVLASTRCNVPKSWDNHGIVAPIERTALERAPSAVTPSCVESSLSLLAVRRATRAESESELVSRPARGEASALGEAYDAHHEQVRAFASRLLGDRLPRDRRGATPC